MTANIYCSCLFLVTTIALVWC